MESAMRDLANSIEVRAVVPPVVVSNDTAQVGAVIDRLGYDSLTYVIATGTLADADATFEVLLEESDASGSGFAQVDAADMLADENPVALNDPALTLTFADDGETRKLGYVGNKRYTRLTLTPSGNSGSAPIAAVAILGHPASAPVA
jgi:hypothetical protein